MTLPVTLFDYGVGNLHSIRKALEHAGAAVTVTEDAEMLLRAPHVVLPGVGAFGACMERLAPVGDELRARLLDGTPCLAVCIGMHLLFASSEESPGVAGLGLFADPVRRFPSSVGKVPHMGWNTLHGPHGLPRWDTRSGVGLRWEDLLPAAGSHVYFVHSYYAAPTEPVTLQSATYGPPDAGVEFAAIVARGNTLATQFHPEKSSGLGTEIVRRWVRQAAAYRDGAGLLERFGGRPPAESQP